MGNGYVQPGSTPQALAALRVHAFVWGFRRAFGDVWVWPGELECLRYVEDEAVEARDRHRRDTLAHFRNNERGDTLAGELADVLLMLASVYPEPWDWDRLLLAIHRAGGALPCDVVDALPALDALVDAAGDARRAYQEHAGQGDEVRLMHVTEHCVRALALLFGLFAHIGADPVGHVQARVERIRRKALDEKDRRERAAHAQVADALYDGREPG